MKEKNEIESLYIQAKLDELDIKASQLYTNSYEALIELTLKNSEFMRKLAKYIYKNNLYEFFDAEPVGYGEGTILKIELPLKKIGENNEKNILCF